MRTDVLAVLLCTLLASLAPGAAADARGPRHRLTFTDPVQVEAYNPVGTYTANGERQSSGEPSIKVDSNGVIYIAGVSTVAQASPLWVSTNDGQSFDEVTTPLNWRERSPYGAEGDIAIDRLDRMYFVDTSVPTLAFSRWSPPRGRLDRPHWDFTFPHTAGVLVGVDDRPWIAYGARGVRESLWLYVNHVSHIAVYRSTDGGRVWEQKLVTTDDAGVPTQRYFTGMIAAPRDSNGTAYLFGNCGDGATLCASHTYDGGEKWEEVEVASVDDGSSIGPIMVSVAVDEAGNVYGVWTETGGSVESGGCALFYAASYDRGRSWSPKIRLSDRDVCATFAWVTAGGPNRIAVAWYETPTPAIHPNSVPADTPWFLKAAVVVGKAGKATVVSGVADPNPVHVGPLERELWDYLQIATGPDGRFHIAYAEDVTAGSDGVLVTAKDTMYVGQAGGPRLS